MANGVVLDGYATERDCPWIEQLIDQYPIKGHTYEMLDAVVLSAHTHVILIERATIGKGNEEMETHFLVVRLTTLRIIEKARRKFIVFNTDRYDRIPHVIPRPQRQIVG